jgi:hypothetical protein
MSAACAKPAQQAQSAWEEETAFEAARMVTQKESNGSTARGMLSRNSG